MDALGCMKRHSHLNDIPWSRAMPVSLMRDDTCHRPEESQWPGRDSMPDTYATLAEWQLNQVQQPTRQHRTR